MGTEERSEVKKKKNDVILIAAILVAALLCCGGIWIYQQMNTKEPTAVVTIDGTIYGRYSLEENRTERIELTDGFYNVLEIKDGKADIIEASCPDKICVDHRSVSKNGETIVCLPNKVVVEIENGEDLQLDAVSN